MAVTDTLYQVRVEGLEQIERGRDNLLRCRVYDVDSVTPASATVTIYDASGTAIISAATATISGGEAQYTLTGATTASLDRELGWRIEWTVVMPDGTTRYPRRDAALVTTRLYPPATLRDLFRRVSALDPDGPRPLTDKTPDELLSYMVEAWLAIEQRLLASGRLPWLVLSPQALREPHILGSLALIFEDLQLRLNPAYIAMAQSYRTAYEDAWSRMVLVEASDDSALTDTSQVSGDSTLWLCGR